LISGLETDRARRAKRRQGFSLTEFAIVLGIVGVILGGFWSVHQITRENARREQMFEEVQLLVANMRSYFMSLPSSQISGAPNYVTYTPEMVNRGIAPPEMLRDRTAAKIFLDHPWGGRVKGQNLGSGGVFLCDGGTACLGAVVGDNGYQTFVLRLVGLPFGASLELLGKITAPSGPPGLLKVFVNGIYYDPLTNGGYPVNLVWAKNYVYQDGNSNLNSLIFVYRLRQQEP
jgi:prepilin-type N-terminal cleavage/methylation domain-containing protein